MSGARKICPYCQFPISNTGRVKHCLDCFIPHHAECWASNEGCTTFACKSSAYQLADDSLIDTETGLPFWRQLYGFRSLTSWKMHIAVIFYLMLSAYFLISLTTADSFMDATLAIAVTLLIYFSMSVAISYVEDDSVFYIFVIWFLLFLYTTLYLSLGYGELVIQAALSVFLGSSIIFSFSGVMVSIGNREPIFRVYKFLFCMAISILLFMLITL